MTTEWRVGGGFHSSFRLARVICARAHTHTHTHTHTHMSPSPALRGDWHALHEVSRIVTSQWIPLVRHVPGAGAGAPPAAPPPAVVMWARACSFYFRPGDDVARVDADNVRVPVVVVAAAHETSDAVTGIMEQRVARLLLTLLPEWRAIVHGDMADVVVVGAAPAPAARLSTDACVSMVQALARRMGCGSNSVLMAWIRSSVHGSPTHWLRTLRQTSASANAFARVQSEF
jgi:hypothetical protein